MSSPGVESFAVLPSDLLDQICNLAKKTIAKNLSGEMLEAEVADDLLVIRELGKNLPIFDAQSLMNDAYLRALEIYSAVKQENDKLMSHALQLISHGSSQAAILEAIELYRNIRSADGKDLGERFISIFRQGEIRLEELRETVRSYAAKRGRNFARNPSKASRMIVRDLDALHKTVRYGRLLDNEEVRDNLAREYLDCISFSAQQASSNYSNIEKLGYALAAKLTRLSGSIRIKAGEICPGAVNLLSGIWTLVWNTNLHVYRAIGCMTLDLVMVLSGRVPLRGFMERYHMYMNPARQSCLEGGSKVKEELSPILRQAIARLSVLINF